MARLTIRSIYALDGYPLEIACYEPFNKRHHERVVILNSGAGIPKSFYEPFASWLADQGLPTVTYDYRGIGASRGKSIHKLSATIRDWGSKDCAAVLLDAFSAYPRAKISVVGHSIGGIVTKFVTTAVGIERLLLISPHTGFFGDYADNSRAKMFIAWHVLMPLITRIAGYFPGRIIGLPEDLPYGVALEWAGRRFEADLKFDILNGGGGGNVACKVLVLRPRDDPFATRAAMKRVGSQFPLSTFTDRILELGGDANLGIGHFGFFKRRNRERLWPIALNWLSDGRAEPIHGFT